MISNQSARVRTHMYPSNMNTTSIALDESYLKYAEKASCWALRNWLYLTLACIYLCPSMPGTTLANAYSYVLILLAVFPFILNSKTRDQAFCSAISLPHIFLGCGTLASLVSVFLSPLIMSGSDYFQIVREFSIWVLATGLFGGIYVLNKEGYRNIIEKACVVFVFMSGPMTVLQEQVPWFRSLMYEFYWTQAGNVSVGTMVSRPGLTFGNPNMLGVALAISLVPILFGKASATKKNTAILFALFTILTTASRTGLIAFLILIPFVASRKVLQFSFLLAVTLSGLYIFTYFTSAGNTWSIDFTERYLTAKYFTSFYDRQLTWQEVLNNKLWDTNLVFGLGPDKSNLSITDSAYVLSLYRYGLVGFLFYSLWIITLCVNPVLKFSPTIAWQQFTLLVPVSLILAVTSFVMSPLACPRLAALFFVIYSYQATKPEKTLFSGPTKAVVP